MRKLILIKHARPTVDPAIPPSRWELSGEGRSSCTPLADALRKHDIKALVSSREIKAQQTAEELSRQLPVPMEVVDDLHEHERDNVPHMPTREFISMMALVFKQQRRRVLGRESAERARERFLRALDRVMERYPEGNIGVVSHGTVISLAVNYLTGEDAYGLWRNMGLPSYVVLELPEYRLAEVVERIQGEQK